MPANDGSGRQHALQYGLGLLIGLIPLMFSWLAVWGSGITLQTGLFILGGSFVLAILGMFFQETRFIAFGLFTLVLISPVAAAASCSVGFRPGA